MLAIDGYCTCRTNPTSCITEDSLYYRAWIIHCIERVSFCAWLIICISIYWLHETLCKWTSVCQSSFCPTSYSPYLPNFYAAKVFYYMVYSYVARLACTVFICYEWRFLCMYMRYLCSYLCMYVAVYVATCKWLK